MRWCRHSDVIFLVVDYLIENILKTSRSLYFSAQVQRHSAVVITPHRIPQWIMQSGIAMSILEEYALRKEDDLQKLLWNFIFQHVQTTTTEQSPREYPSVALWGRKLVNAV